MTKEQFIKRVEEITGYSFHSTEDAGSYDNYYVFSNREYDHLIYFEINDYSFKCWYNHVIQGNKIQLPIDIPTKWFIPLGEAMKEYYND